MENEYVQVNLEDNVCDNHNIDCYGITILQQRCGFARSNIVLSLDRILSNRDVPHTSQGAQVFYCMDWDEIAECVLFACHSCCCSWIN